jgi:aspartyl-tRNA(Asn)/glutamyl-tRNA(Gln) amidotransferase subunit A
MNAWHGLPIAELARRLRDGRTTSVALAEAALARARALNPSLHAFIHLAAERALADAGRADRELAQGVDRGLLHGVPYALKDIFDVAGMPTTCHSHLMAGHVARRDCHVVERLSQAGAVLLGKLATHEFALGGPSRDLPFPPACNPWSPAHFAGGSSSGSAVAVAAGMTGLAIGSDTSGSIRGPAFYCGVVGLKPTYGLVSRRGVFPLSYSLDHCGPMTWTVEDAAHALQAIAGHDPHDIGSVHAPACDYAGRIGRDLHGLRVGVPRHFWTGPDGASPEIVRMLDDAAETLARLGARVDEVTLPDFELFSACGRLIMTAEGYAIHEAKLRERGRDFGRYTYQRLVPGAGITSADLIQAQRLRLQLARQVNDGPLRTHDLLIGAIGLGPAPRVDSFPEDWPPSMRMQAIQFTVTGNPALALPGGHTPEGLPIGFQIVGRPFEEATVLQAGAAYEADKRWYLRTPRLEPEGVAAA